MKMILYWILLLELEQLLLPQKRLGRRFIGVDIDEKYVNITKDNLSRELSNSKIGDIWVSFYLDEIITIKDIDWVKLAQDFLIPENIKEIDFTKIKFDRQTRLLKYEEDRILPIYNKQVANRY